MYSHYYDIKVGESIYHSCCHCYGKRLCYRLSTQEPYIDIASIRICTVFFYTRILYLFSTARIFLPLCVLCTMCIFSRKSIRGQRISSRCYGLSRQLILLLRRWLAQRPSPAMPSFSALLYNRLHQVHPAPAKSAREGGSRLLLLAFYPLSLILYSSNSQQCLMTIVYKDTVKWGIKSQVL